MLLRYDYNAIISAYYCFYIIVLSENFWLRISELNKLRLIIERSLISTLREIFKHYRDSFLL